MFEWTFFRNETKRGKCFSISQLENRVASTLECHWHNSTPVLHHQLKSCSLCWTHNRRCARPHSRTSQRVLWDPAPDTQTEREKYHRLRVYLKTKEGTCCCLWPRLAREPRKPPEPRRNLGRILRQTTTDRQTDRQIDCGRAQAASGWREPKRARPNTYRCVLKPGTCNASGLLTGGRRYRID